MSRPSQASMRGDRKRREPGTARVVIDWTPAARQRAGIGRFVRGMTGALLRRNAHDYGLFVADRLGPRGAAAALGGSTGASSSATAARDSIARAAQRWDSGQASGPGADPSTDSLRPRLITTGIPAAWMSRLWHRGALPQAVRRRWLAVERWTGPIDLFHATDYLAPPTRSSRIVLTIHDLSFLRCPERADPALARHLARAVPRSAARADHVLADSRHTRSDILDLLGLPPDRVSVAYGAVDPGVRRVTDSARVDAVRARLGLGRPFVLGVGTLEPRKDWPTLIRAFAAEEGLRDRYCLAIVGGRGWRDRAILDAAERARGAGVDVRTIGFVPDADLPALYSAAHAFAFPSVYEGFGLPPLEALACGLPSAVSASSSLPEVVGDAALLVPPGDPAAWSAALLRLVDDDGLRLRLADAGPRRSALFTWDACAEAVESAYASALSS